MCSPQQENIGRNSRYDIALPEPIANELRMLKAKLEKSAKLRLRRMLCVGGDRYVTDFLY